MLKKFILSTFALLFAIVIQAQQSKRVLFLGNSYTATNNLPQMVADMASSTNDALFFDAHTPGGYTLNNHAADPTTTSKIAQGTWDYVVLQEQSQIPSFPASQVNSMMFPYGVQLDNLINQINPCTETVLYMTWGRKNGDASNCPGWPPVCTYEGMDSLIKMRYMMLADSTQAEVSPVGAVWRYIRDNYPNIELYQPDESHPSIAGTYAAALTFYTVFFRQDPALVTFNSSLSSTDAHSIKTAVRNIVFNNFEEWFIGRHTPQAVFNYTFTNTNTVVFQNHSKYADQYLWEFGDGDTSSLFEPTHNYANGLYNVLLTVRGCGKSDTASAQIQVGPVSINNVLFKDVQVYPNPFATSFKVQGIDAKIQKVQLLSVTGQIVPIKVTSGSEIIITVGDIVRGTYLLYISTDKGSLIRKITKQ